eukprot:1178490-Prorocentrum_minimum.AAC.2
MYPGVRGRWNSEAGGTSLLSQVRRLSRRAPVLSRASTAPRVDACSCDRGTLVTCPRSGSSTVAAGPRSHDSVPSIHPWVLPTLLLIISTCAAGSVVLQIQSVESLRAPQN